MSELTGWLEFFFVVLVVIGMVVVGVFYSTSKIVKASRDTNAEFNETLIRHKQELLIQVKQRDQIIKNLELRILHLEEDRDNRIIEGIIDGVVIGLNKVGWKPGGTV